MHPEKATAMSVKMSIYLQILYAAKPQKPIKHTENYKPKHKNQNYRKQSLKKVTGWNMQLKYITGTQKTVHTSQSDSVNVQTDYKNSVIYRNVSQKRHLKIWQKNKHSSLNESLNYKTGMSRV